MLLKSDQVWFPSRGEFPASDLSVACASIVSGLCLQRSFWLFTIAWSKMSIPEPEPSNSHRSTRYTAELARKLIASCMRESEIDELSSSEEKFAKSIADRWELSSSESDAEVTPPPPKQRSLNTKHSGKGKRRGKRSIPLISTSRSTFARRSRGQVQVREEEWRHVTEGATKNPFRFHPTREPGVSSDLGLDTYLMPLTVSQNC